VCYGGSYKRLDLVTFDLGCFSIVTFTGASRTGVQLKLSSVAGDRWQL